MTWEKILKGKGYDRIVFHETEAGRKKKLKDSYFIIFGNIDVVLYPREDNSLFNPKPWSFKHEYDMHRGEGGYGRRREWETLDDIMGEVEYTQKTPREYIRKYIEWKHPAFFRETGYKNYKEVQTEGFWERHDSTTLERNLKFIQEIWVDLLSIKNNLEKMEPTKIRTIRNLMDKYSNPIKEKEILNLLNTINEKPNSIQIEQKVLSDKEINDWAFKQIYNAFDKIYMDALKGDLIVKNKESFADYMADFRNNKWKWENVTNINQDTDFILANKEILEEAVQLHHQVDFHDYLMDSLNPADQKKITDWNKNLKWPFYWI